MYGLLAVVGFAAVMALLNRMLRRKERDGDFDPGSPSSAAQPGLRRLFDGSEEGWRGDGIAQRPPRREHMN